MHQGSQAHATHQQTCDARTAAISLLQRSVQMKHKQLTVVRLLDAITLQAPIHNDLWEQCLAVARSVASTKELRMLYALREQAVTA